jgi:hypothetical protein
VIFDIDELDITKKYRLVQVSSSLFSESGEPFADPLVSLPEITLGIPKADKIE